MGIFDNVKKLFEKHNTVISNPMEVKLDNDKLMTEILEEQKNARATATKILGIPSSYSVPAQRIESISLSSAQLKFLERYVNTFPTSSCVSVAERIMNDGFYLDTDRPTLNDMRKYWKNKRALSTPVKLMTTEERNKQFDEINGLLDNMLKEVQNK